MTFHNKALHNSIFPHSLQYKLCFLAKWMYPFLSNELLFNHRLKKSIAWETKFWTLNCNPNMFIAEHNHTTYLMNWVTPHKALLTESLFWSGVCEVGLCSFVPHLTSERFIDNAFLESRELKGWEMCRGIIYPKLAQSHHPTMRIRMWNYAACVQRTNGVYVCKCLEYKKSKAPQVVFSHWPQVKIAWLEVKMEGKEKGKAGLLAAGWSERLVSHTAAQLEVKVWPEKADNMWLVM